LPVTNPRNLEIVVALQSTENELRVFDIAYGEFVLRYQVDLPTRIEAIDVDDADNDGLTDIVVGLDGSSTENHVRIYRYDSMSDTLLEEAVSGTLPLHVEDVDIGDADNDGENEIVVALERLYDPEPSDVSRVLLFEYEDGAWVGPQEVSPPEALSAQDVAIGDADNDGTNEIAVLFANVHPTEPDMLQIRLYENVGNQWVREDVTPLVTSGLANAERLIIADVDNDSENELVTSYWDGTMSSPGRLVTLNYNGVDWIEELVSDSVGIIDSLSAGDFDHDSYVDLVAGTGVLDSARVEYFENQDGIWQPPTVVSGSFGSGIIWDVELGDADNDGCNEILSAIQSKLRLYKPGSTQSVSILGFAVPVDSAQLGDIDNDGTNDPVTCDLREVVVGPGPGFDNNPLVRIFPPLQGAQHQYEFRAYGPTHYGVNVTCGDVAGDPLDEILTGAGPGDIYGPHVRGFEVDGTPLPGLSFLAYGTNKYGVNVAAGDIDGDGFEEIITGAGPGAVFGPHVRGWDYDGGPGVTPVPGVSYFAYGTPKWGVNVSAGDIDGDGYDEIVTGAGPGAVYGPHVRGWDVDGGSVTSIPGVNFLAYGTNKYGVNATCGDIDGDGIDEIITGAGPGAVFGPHVRGWNVDGGSATAMANLSFFAWPAEELRYGANVFSGADLNGNGRDEIVVGQGPDPVAGTWIKVYMYDGSQEIEWLSLEAFGDMGLTEGVNVAAGRF